MASVSQQVLMADAPLLPATITYIGTTNVGGIVTDSTTVAGVSIGTPASNRMVYQLVHWFSTGAVAPLASATIGGVTAKVQVSNGSTSAGSVFLGSAIISAFVPTGTTATVVLNFATGATGHTIILGTYSATGVLSDTPISTISDNPNTVLSYSGAINVKKDGILLLGAVFYSANTGYTVSGANQDYTVSLATNFYSVGSSLAVSATQAGRPVGVTAIGGLNFSGTVAAASFR